MGGWERVPQGSGFAHEGYDYNLYILSSHTGHPLPYGNTLLFIQIHTETLLIMQTIPKPKRLKRQSTYTATVSLPEILWSVLCTTVPHCHRKETSLI